MKDIVEFYMRRCLELARLGQGKTHPNPMVGCVVLDREWRKIGEGFHAYYGGPHAEVMALEQAGDRARDGILFVSLEPCNHTGQTPPCAEKVYASGIRQVYVGMRDPNPKAAGGNAMLHSRGVKVTESILTEECRKLNEAFCHAITTKRPFVVLKAALTADGKVATRSGDSQWITGPFARRWVHQLRAESDAILSTAQTVIADNARLSVRDAALLGKPPVRIILDRKLLLNPQAQALFQPEKRSGPIWVFTQTGNLETPEAQAIKSAGARLFEVPMQGNGLNLAEVMRILGQEKISQILVEAGGTLASSLLEQRLVQKLWLMSGPLLLGDPHAIPAFNGSPIHQLNQGTRLRYGQHFKLENTMVVEVYPKFTYNRY